jgi:hypothetical protein
MAAVDQNSLRKLVEGQLLRLEGNAFQDCMDRLGLELYPGDYQPVRAAGPKGDTKNDDYCPKARVFFAAHATRGERIDKTKAKIRGDLEGCFQEHRDVKAWRFLTNDTLPGEVDQFIDNELRPLYRGVTIEVWGLKMLADEISKLKRAQVDKIIDVISAVAPKPKPPEKPQVVPLSHMQTGRDLWPILSVSLAWLPAVEPDGCTEEEEDLIDGVVQTFTDWLESISPPIWRVGQMGGDWTMQTLKARLSTSTSSFPPERLWSSVGVTSRDRGELITWYEGRLRPQDLLRHLNHLCDALERVPGS